MLGKHYISYAQMNVFSYSSADEIDFPVHSKCLPLRQSLLQQGLCSLQHFSSCHTKATPRHHVTCTTSGGRMSRLLPQEVCRHVRHKHVFGFSPTTSTFSWPPRVWDVLQQQLDFQQPAYYKTVSSSN